MNCYCKLNNNEMKNGKVLDLFDLTLFDSNLKSASGYIILTRFNVLKT